MNKELLDIKNKHLSLDMSRGKPSTELLDLSNDFLDILNSSTNYIIDNIDVRNYGKLDGIEPAKRLLGDILGVSPNNIIVGGNSSLNLMFDQIMRSYCFGVCGSTPWSKLDKVKWICLTPGYDRHFAICEHFGFEMIDVPLLEDGPDMDKIEELVKDPSVKGLWAVPKYSNPSGITYSKECIKRLANLHPASKDFRIYYDNAYALHNFDENDDELTNIFDEAKKAHNEDIVYMFTSTSKIVFPGGGISCIAASENNLNDIKKHLSIQTVNYDKINQLRHVLYFKDLDSIKEHMKKHQKILKEKFNIVYSYLDMIPNLVSYHKANGGYFVCIQVKGIAKEVISLCEELGLKLTPAGATHPYHNDPTNSYIRLAPSYLSNEDLTKAMNVIVEVIKHCSK